ncbi:hypothetical protein Ddye_004963 [Dipteronia dyeriana]|uniref:Retrotransposon gag domain-containing protein n=1 Tax=Dipteronia dyeriana TaxID=168575 RepID=A0AAD9XFM2_9ROSI|nr:hypothetical protein Ddye_004963 [Dipteronia dyeriana]
MVRNTVLTRGQLQMRCFQYCLMNRAMQWYIVLRPGTLTTWPHVCEAFYNKFFPTAKARELTIKITTFSKEDGEPFYKVWERFHLLLAQMPPHNYPDELKVTSFYQGLSTIT